MLVATKEESNTDTMVAAAPTVVSQIVARWIGRFTDIASTKLTSIVASAFTSSKAWSLEGFDIQEY